MKKRLLVILVAILSVCCLIACGTSKTQQKETNNTVQDERTVPGGESTKTKNDTAILVVSFGTSYNDSRDITIGAIEQAISKAYPEYEVRRAFTSQIIIDILKSRDGLEIDNVTEALDQAVEDGIKELIVQPTHLMKGYEYNDVLVELTKYLDKFDKIVIAEPLLANDADFDTVAKAITEKTASYDNDETAICFMGHGTLAEANVVYSVLQDKLTKAGYENYYVGTVEATPNLEDVVAALKAKGTYKKVVLMPLMVVAGDHANNDMAGVEEDSWRTAFEKEGYEVECIIEGLGQIKSIQDIYVAHLKAAIDAGIAFKGVEITEAESNVSELTDGTYNIEVESTSSMFKVEKAELTRTGGKMTAVITLSGKGYGKLYMGTSDAAANASEADYIPFVEDESGAYTYTIPVAALDQSIDCAAYSIRKEKWYDRQLIFKSDSISTDSGDKRNATVPKKVLEEIKPGQGIDGTYSIDVTLDGGSGRANVLSPATITIKGDSMVATIEWSSSNYDYMLVNGEKYLPVNTEGNSVFEIPVDKLDAALEVIGDTVAMSKPRKIEYTLTFHSNTIKAIE